MMQIDLQKAYGMADWRALEKVLLEFGFPKKFVMWIMKAVRTISYRFNVNGRYTNKMKEKRGIRQGDPI